MSTWDLRHSSDRIAFPTLILSEADMVPHSAYPSLISCGSTCQHTGKSLATSCSSLVAGVFSVKNKAQKVLHHYLHVYLILILLMGSAG